MTKRLVLKSETIRVLSGSELDHAIGGQGKGIISTDQPGQHQPLSSMKPGWSGMKSPEAHGNWGGGWGAGKGGADGKLPPAPKLGG